MKFRIYTGRLADVLYVSHFLAFVIFLEANVYWNFKGSINYHSFLEVCKMCYKNVENFSKKKLKNCLTSSILYVFRRYAEYIAHTYEYKRLWYVAPNVVHCDFFQVSGAPTLLSYTPVFVPSKSHNQTFGTLINNVNGMMRFHIP